MTREAFMEEVMTPNEDGTVPSLEGYLLNDEVGQQCELYENYSKEDLAAEFRSRGGSFLTVREVDSLNSFPIGTTFIIHSPGLNELGFFVDGERVRVKGYSNMGLMLLESMDREQTGYLMERESLSHLNGI